MTDKPKLRTNGKPKKGIRRRRKDQLTFAEWSPSEKMETYLEAFINEPVNISDSHISRISGVSRVAMCKWRKDKNFRRWFYNKIIERRDVDFARLHKFGMVQAMKSGRGLPYWKELYVKTGEALGALAEQKAPEQNIFALAILKLNDKMDNEGPPPREIIEAEWKKES